MFLYTTNQLKWLFSKKRYKLLNYLDTFSNMNVFVDQGFGYLKVSLLFLTPYLPYSVITLSEALLIDFPLLLFRFFTFSRGSRGEKVTGPKSWRTLYSWLEEMRLKYLTGLTLTQTVRHGARRPRKIINLHNIKLCYYWHSTYMI